MIRFFPAFWNILRRLLVKVVIAVHLSAHIKVNGPTRDLDMVYRVLNLAVEDRRFNFEC
jgi:hypothetical protein